jgi:hypothetical protein
MSVSLLFCNIPQIFAQEHEKYPTLGGGGGVGDAVDGNKGDCFELYKTNMASIMPIALQMSFT